jgi:hypothetical protein
VSRLLIFYGVYEKERAFAAHTLTQLLDVLEGHEVHVAVQDDASPSHLGQQLKDAFSARAPTRVIRLHRSMGYFGTFERTMSFLHHATTWGDRYDYVLRVDPDISLGSPRMRDLFAPGRLPTLGMIGPTMTLRKRDLVLFAADLFPAGFRRRVRESGIDRKWELRRSSPVFWSDIGRRSLLRGFRGRIVAGMFQVIAWDTVLAMENAGWLSRPRRGTGLMLQDDVLLSMMVVAAGHPLFDFEERLPGFRAEMFLGSATTAEEVRRRGVDLLHPLKDAEWANRLRTELEGAWLRAPETVSPDRLKRSAVRAA